MKKFKLFDSKPEDFVLYLQDITNKLEKIKEKEDISKIETEELYNEILKLVRNCNKIELNFQILITSKLAKYVHLFHTILLDINDYNCYLYQSLLPKISKLDKKCKSLLLKFVN